MTAFNNYQMYDDKEQDDGRQGSEFHRPQRLDSRQSNSSLNMVFNDFYYTM